MAKPIFGQFWLDVSSISPNLLKRYLQHDTTPFCLLVLHLRTFLLNYAHKSKFCVSDPSIILFIHLFFGEEGRLSFSSYSYL